MDTAIRPDELWVNDILKIAKKYLGYDMFGKFFHYKNPFHDC